MAATDKDRSDKVEYPRGEIEILAPGEDVRRRGPFAAVVASALFVFVAGFLAVVVTIAVAVVAGFVLRNKLRQWLGR